MRVRRTASNSLNRLAPHSRPRAKWNAPSVPRKLLSALVLAAAITGGCGSYDGDSAPPADATPEKVDGTESHEFEQDDLDAADGASDAVKDYCSGAVSEAQ